MFRLINIGDDQVVFKGKIGGHDCYISARLDVDDTRAGHHPPISVWKTNGAWNSSAGYVTAVGVWEKFKIIPSSGVTTEKIMNAAERT